MQNGKVRLDGGTPTVMKGVSKGAVLKKRGKTERRKRFFCGKLLLFKKKKSTILRPA